MSKAAGKLVKVSKSPASNEQYVLYSGNDMSSAGSTGYSVPPTPDVEQMGEFPMSQSFMNLTLEEQEMKREEWRKELAEVLMYHHLSMWQYVN